MSDHAAPHAHVGLEYQPAMPLPNGKLFLWLFLSTEIMFFAGLIGAYIVLRFGAPAWPSTHDVHLVEYLGAINTGVLIASSITVVLALEAAKRNNASGAKGWIILTFVLGSIFLGVKGFEYNAKFSHQIYPALPHSPIWEKADVNYASAVRLRLAELRTPLLAIKERDEEEEKQLAVVDSVQLDLDAAEKAIRDEPESPRVACCSCNSPIGSIRGPASTITAPTRSTPTRTKGKRTNSNRTPPRRRRPRPPPPGSRKSRSSPPKAMRPKRAMTRPATTPATWKASTTSTPGSSSRS